MSHQVRPNEGEWRSAKDTFAVGVLIRGTVSEIVPFGMFVDLPDSRVPGVVLASGFPSGGGFQQRAETHPVGAAVDVVVVGASEGRLQIDLKVATSESCCDSS